MICAITNRQHCLCETLGVHWDVPAHHWSRDKYKMDTLMRLRRLLPTTSPPGCHSSVPKETSLACDFSTGRMWEYLSEQPASLAVQQRHWQTNRLLSHRIQYTEMCCKTRGVVTVRKEEPEKQQLGLLEGNKKMQFLLNALQAPSAKKEDKNFKKVWKRHYNCYHTK